MQNRKLEANLDRVKKSFFKRKNFLLDICELHSSIYLQRVILCTSMLGTCIEHSSFISAKIAESSRNWVAIIAEFHLLGQAWNHVLMLFLEVPYEGVALKWPCLWEGCPDPKDRIANAPDCSRCMWHCDVAECEIGSCRDCRHLEEDWEGWIRAEWDPQNTSQELTESCEARFWKDSGGYGWRPVWALHPV